jgi:succinyl-CoA synthetase beta subunit
MSTLDLLHKAKGKPANFVDLGGDYRHCCPPSGMQERIRQGLDLIVQEAGVKVILVNILGGAVSCLQVAESIAGFLKWQPTNRSLPPLVVRLVGEQLPSARGLLAAMDIPVYESMDAAVAEAVALAVAVPSAREERSSLLLASA